MIKKKKKLMIVNWHQKDGRLSGTDLVYAFDKWDARKCIYNIPDSVETEAESRKSDGAFWWDGLTPKEIGLAKRGFLVNLETGT